MTVHNHIHPHQQDIEDTPFTEKMLLAQAVEELIIKKGLTSPEKLREQIEFLDSREPAIGARLVAQSWLDPVFKQELLDSVNQAAHKIGIDTGEVPIQAVENTDKIHNVIVCTLCSCYPRMLIGLPPDWYKSREYRSRTVREPREVLKEFGTRISDEIEICVHDSTADLRYIVLPLRPKGTRSWNIDRLAKLVTRDSMIGVSQASIQ